MVRSLLSAVLVVALVSACSEDVGSGLSITVATQVGIEPATFVGDVACSANQGAMQSYVVTLQAFEDAEDTTPFSLPASLPTPCSHAVAFRELIVPGNRYIAEIDAYDVPASSLSPFGGATSGARQMRDATTGEVVSPRWTTTCGAGAPGGVEALPGQAVSIGDCAPLATSSASNTTILIDPVAVLGPEPCALADSFDIVDESGDLPALKQVSCSSSPIELTASAGQSYQLYATTPGLTPLLGTTCAATALAGQAVLARCNPPSASGAMQLSLSGLTSNGEARCPSDGFFEVQAGQEIINNVPLPCSSTAHVTPLDPGIQLLDITIFDASGQVLDQTTKCGAEIIAGQTATGVCI